MIADGTDAADGVDTANAARANGKYLHVRIIRASAAFRDDPVDVLGRVLDVAGFAVNAVLSIDLQSRLAALLDEFVDTRRAITLLRTRI